MTGPLTPEEQTAIARSREAIPLRKYSGRLAQENVRLGTNLCETCRTLLPFKPLPEHDPGNGCWRCAHQEQLGKLEARGCELAQENTELRKSDADSSRWEVLARDRGRRLDQVEALAARRKAALEQIERRLTIALTVLDVQHPSHPVIALVCDDLATALAEEP